MNVLEGYFSVHNFSDREKITFALLKLVPHVQNWWGTYCEQNSSDESGMFETNPTWASFIDSIREQYYPVGNYDAVHKMDHSTSRKGADGVGVHQ